MSVQREPERGDYVVRWRQGGRHLKRRFKKERDAIDFERTVMTARPQSASGLSSVEARLAELEARLIATKDRSGQAQGDVYAYNTKQGRRWYFKKRNADGTSSSKRGFTSRRAALQAKAALQEGMRRGEIKASRETFAEYWTRFLAAKRPYVTRGTLEDCEAQGRRRLLPFFGDRKLAGIERGDVRAWLADMAELVLAGELSPKTVNNALTLLSVCMTQALDDRVIAANPCLRVSATFPPTTPRWTSCASTRSGATSTPAPRTSATWLASCWARAAVSRKPSPCAGRTSDFSDRSVRIARQRDRYSDGTTQTQGKRIRRVHVGPQLADELRRLRARRMASGVDDGGRLFLCPPPVRGRYVGRTAPTPPNRKTAHDWHEATLQDAGLRDMPLHALRHTAAAAWIATGRPLMFVQRQLGHASITTTEHHYGHLEQTFFNDAAAATEAAIQRADPGLR